jgi:thioredoxin reductase (NADPH)
MIFDVIIIGSGPAGYTSAIYSTRAGRKALLITGAQQGGQLMITSSIENYPGFKSISGPELMDNMREQVENLGVEMVHDTVESVDFPPSGVFRCVGESGTAYSGRAVIIATGAVSRWLGLAGEKKYLGTGVSACATCDGFFFKNKDVAVIGGGNTAVEEAIFLTNFAKSVTLIHRRDALRAEKVMQKRLMENPKISILWNTVVMDILGDGGRVTELLLQSTIDENRFGKKIDGVFVAIGHQPETSIFKGKLDLDEAGYIITEKTTSATSVRGVFAAGDVCDPTYRQAITSAGQGCMAAMDVDRFLSEVAD